MAFGICRVKIFLDQIINIQDETNNLAIQLNRPMINILNQEEIDRIKELILLKTYPEKWNGDEPIASLAQDIHYADGTIMKRLFYE
jgi:DNA sulfur modification protein DndC